MLVFLGSFAGLFYTLLIGWAWPSQDRTSLALAIASGIGKSFWLSWLLVFACYFLAIPGPLTFPGAVLAWVVCLSWWWRSGRSITYRISDAILCMVGLGALIVFAWLTAVGRIGAYTPTFFEWDALVSWNKWGLELAENRYVPYNAAYPVLLPGLWSLIYRAQGDSSVWLLAKASLFIFPAVLIFSLATLAKVARLISLVLLTLFVAFYFLSWYSPEMLSGYMDVPVAVMMFVAALMMIGAAETEKLEDEALYLDFLTAGALFSGMASVTKQAGSVAVVVFCMFVAMNCTGGRLVWKRAGLLILISIVPLGTYLILYASVRTDVVGNLQYLAELSAGRAGHGGVIMQAWRFMKVMLGGWLLVALPCVALLNIANIRDLRGQLGLLLLVASVAGFFSFAYCCSYDLRGGLWIPALLIPSTVLALAPVERRILGWWKPADQKRLPELAMPLALAGLALVFGMAGALAYPDEAIHLAQEDEQSKVVPSGLAKLIRSNRQQLDGAGILLSPYRPVGWLPGVLPHYRACNFDAVECANYEIARASKLFILVSPAEPLLRYDYLRDRLTPEKLLGEADGFALYGPFHNTVE